jgi:2-keto-4-pentenoate hydratase
MTETFEAEAMAARLIAAHRGGALVDAAAIGAGPQNFEDAFSVQRLVMAELGPVGGYKTSNAATGERVVLAPIAAANIRSSPASFGGDEMRRVGIELEIAFRIDAPLPLPGSDGFEDKLKSVVSLVPAIEMVDTRLADLEGAPTLVKMADNQSGFGLVVGESIQNWADIDIAAPAITFTVAGQQVGTTAGSVPGGTAFEALVGLIGAIRDHCGGLQVGQYVTTGSLSGLHWIEKGAEVEGTIAGLGRVAVSVGA